MSSVAMLYFALKIYSAVARDNRTVAEGLVGSRQKVLDMLLGAVLSVLCLSAKSYRASKPKLSQDKRQNNQGE